MKKYAKSDKHKECMKKYSKSAKRKEYIKKYQKTDKFKEYHKEYRKEYERERRKADPLYALTKRTRTLITSSLKKQNYTKKSKTYELLGCSYEEFMAFLGPKPCEGAHLDHICPCAEAQNEEELIKLQNFRNFQWLSAEENTSKNDTMTSKGLVLRMLLLGR